MEQRPSDQVLLPGEELSLQDLGVVRVGYVWTPEADADDSRYAGSLEARKWSFTDAIIEGIQS